MDDIHKFFNESSSEQHWLLGLKVLNSLVENVQPDEQTGEYSKYVGHQEAPVLTSIRFKRNVQDFRDQCLGKIVEFGFEVLTKIISTSDTPNAPLLEINLLLIEHCLTYDFLGINLDKSDEFLEGLVFVLEFHPFGSK